MKDDRKTKKQLISELTELRQRVAELKESGLELKRAEEALSVSEERFRTQYQGNPTPTFTWQSTGDDFVLIDCNEAAKTITDGKVTRYIGKSANEMYVNRIEVLQDLWRCLTEKGIIRSQMESQHFMPGKLIDVTYVFILPDLITVQIGDITERQRAADALRESEERYRTVVENANEGILVAQDGMVKFVNPKALQMTGYTEDEAISRPFIDFIHPDDQQTVMQHHLRRLKGEEVPEIYSHRIITKDGDVKWLENNEAIINWEGRPATLNFLSDITKRVRAEAALQESEEKFRNLFNNSEVGMFRTRLDGSETLDMNEKFLEIFGRTREEMLGSPSIIHWADPLERQEMVCRLEAESRVTDFECGMLNKRGEVRRCLASARVYRDQGILEGSVLDITERKGMEDELRNTSETLQAVIQASPVGISLLDPDGNVQDVWNPAAEQMFGWSKQEILGRLLPTVPQDKLEEFKGLLRRVLGGNAFAGLELRRQKKDGSPIDISLSTAPLRSKTGEIVRILGMLEDITEETRLRKESELSLQQLIQADRLAALGELVAGVAHEINNPNSFISYNIPLLEETWGIFAPILDEYSAAHPDWKRNGMTFNELLQDMQEIIEAIKTGSERINKVVLNLKDFAGLDESGHARAVQVNELIERALMIVGAQLRKSFGKMDVRLAGDLPSIQGHPQKLEQVVVNLLLNASQAVSGKPEGKLSLATRYIERLQAVLIEVEDNGVGMGKEVLNKLFEPFFTTRREKGGTGLGLSVSYGLVREHNGVIGVLSRPGLGTRFTVFLPLDKSVQFDLRPTVFCVDDDLRVLRMLESLFLKVSDAFMATTTDPEAVVAYLEEHPEVDVVLSDIVMPGMDGWDLLAKIKARFPLIPVILYSGHPSALEGKQPGLMEPDALLQKPFQVEQLLRIIDGIGRQRL
jgi:PAS domain S-box-containing protein